MEGTSRTWRPCLQGLSSCQAARCSLALSWLPVLAQSGSGIALIRAGTSGSAWVQLQKVEGNTSTVRGQVREQFTQSTTCSKRFRRGRDLSGAIDLRRMQGRRNRSFHFKGRHRGIRNGIIPSEEEAPGTGVGVNGFGEAEKKIQGVEVIKKVRS